MIDNIVAWIILLGFYLGFALPVWRSLFTSISKRLGDWSVGIFLLPYLLTVRMQLDLEELLRFAVCLALPTIWLRLRPSKNRPFDIYHILAILSVWIPMEFDLFVLLLNLVFPFVKWNTWLSGVHLLPSVNAELAPGLSLPVGMLTGVSLTLYLFAVHHPLDGFNFTFRLDFKDLKNVLLGLLAYAFVSVPLGIGLGFLRFAPKAPPFLQMVSVLLFGYFFIALIEEMLFRGVIQNLLIRRLKNVYSGLVLAAVIFGLSHINNATMGFSVPNWAYALMAGLAGLSYGWVWMRTKKFTASAITHALVNFLWWILFQ